MPPADQPKPAEAKPETTARPPADLNIDFNAKAAEQWTVSGWSWSGY